MKYRLLVDVRTGRESQEAVQAASDKRTHEPADAGPKPRRLKRIAYILAPLRGIIVFIAILSAMGVLLTIVELKIRRSTLQNSADSYYPPPPTKLPADWASWDWPQLTEAAVQRAVIYDAWEKETSFGVSLNLSEAGVLKVSAGVESLPRIMAGGLWQYPPPLEGQHRALPSPPPFVRLNTAGEPKMLEFLADGERFKAEPIAALIPELGGHSFWLATEDFLQIATASEVRVRCFGVGAGETLGREAMQDLRALAAVMGGER